MLLVLKRSTGLKFSILVTMMVKGKNRLKNSELSHAVRQGVKRVVRSGGITRGARGRTVRQNTSTISTYMAR